MTTINLVICLDQVQKCGWLSKSLILSLLSGQMMGKVFIFFTTFISKTLICYIAGNSHFFVLKNVKFVLNKIITCDLIISSFVVIIGMCKHLCHMGIGYKIKISKLQKQFNSYGSSTPHYQQKLFVLMGTFTYLMKFSMSFLSVYAAHRLSFFKC